MGGETHPRVVPAMSSYPKLATRPVGQQIESIYTDRLRQFTSGGQYSSQNLVAKLHDETVDDEDHVRLYVYSVPDLARPTFKEATSHEFKKTHRGELFGPSWATHWFRIHLTVPTSMVKAEHLEFHWDANNEGLVWTEDGIPLQGLTGGERTEWVLPDSFRDGKEHVFYIEMACNSMFGNPPGDIIQPPDPNKYFQLQTARIAAVNLQARQLYVDFWIIGDAAREFPGDSWERHEALQVCNAIIDNFIAAGGSQQSIIEGRKIAQKYVGENVDSSKVYDTDNEAIISGIGHCHIDTCWLWPFAETKRKVARSWLNQCDLIERYPEHRFTASQAQQYKWLEINYPAAFDRVKSKVKQGKFQPVGGSWVEHDTNMPSGESLVRQFLYGQRYFESHFGDRCRTFWLPDTFGYSSQLPQLCRLAGMNRFFTQKLSWNNINNFPHTTFNWVSLDGSQVICHMAPAETYTAEAHFGDVRRSVTQHKSMNQDNTSLLVFGKGDGGGGPLREHLEKLRRCRGLSDKTGLLPRVKMGTSVDEFYDKLEEKAANGTEFVTWYGELYFELHRGTYTTQANNKLYNRKSEIMMHDLEYLATLATLKSKSYQYPKKDFDEIWENVLLCQFHDCLPGSCIEMCYDDTDKIYAHNFKLGEKLVDDVLSALGLSKDISLPGELVALNTLPWPRSEIVKVPSPKRMSNATDYAIVSGEPGLMYAKPAASAVRETASVTTQKDGSFVLENKALQVRIKDGCITSLIDLKADREVIANGKANQFVLFDDKPLYWQAWDVEVYHLNSRKELQSGKTRIVEESPYRVSVETETKISEQSWIKTTISLSANVEDNIPSYVEMESEVEWHEDKNFLKVEFPVDVVNTEASYETQFGIVRRPTHYNTTWDMAKFEVCSHKFADLSEHGYGVSILNDCKYGFATAGSLMRLSLLRSPKAPDAHADMGRHRIRYAIMPHAGGLDARTVRAARAFNYPVQLYRSVVPEKKPTAAADDENEKLFRSIALSSDSNPSLILDTIKRGEDDEDVRHSSSQSDFPTDAGLKVRKGKSIILRIYESVGGKARGSIATTLPVKKVTRCNLLEDDGEELTMRADPKAKGGERTKYVGVEVRPFEVVTVRLQL
ncbi:MAG: hypothetical protein Q9160_001714 [Pyrenula sp. 1 TL-2023]